ncbi:amidase [Halopseudomonas phragmitis]|uniref:Amidase n=1 Tax=Halopseudomonas phragmitis TaxID=1931241 RepID=A0A1V0B0S6_9GAMM|nr:amidase [Halopseudomonas phragmitis]AQZ93374.1 amidase [Halopseudomonas phragmitis]
MSLTTREYLNHDATALAERIARREISASELLDLTLERCQRLNPQLNAICQPMFEIARQRLNEPLNGPLAGVPILIKDAVQDYAGLPTGNGSKVFSRIPQRKHSHIVQRLLEAGAVIIGKTNTPELALKGVTDPALFGTTHNPWNPAHTPGGSSGGSAAAVAAGLVPMAGANDGGGSIRIPAACCGLFGLRPSRGLISVGPGAAEIWEGASSDGVLTRSVRDTALALDILVGNNPGDPLHTALPERSYRSLTQQEPGQLRIGFSTRSPLGTPVHPEAVKAVEHAVKLLQALGHEVVEAAPDHDGQMLARCYLNLYFGQVAATLDEARAIGARDEEFELLTRTLAAFGRVMSSADYVRSHRQWNSFSQALGLFHQQHDLYLTPTLAHPPIRHEQGQLPTAQARILELLLATGLLPMLARWGVLENMVNDMARKNLTYVPFTQLANLTGTPAMSVPLYWTADGLPLGVQFGGPPGSEPRLLQLARQLEQAQPWAERWPAMVQQDLGRAGSAAPQVRKAVPCKA